MPVATVSDQCVDTEISGPGGANRLYLCTGTAGINTSASAGSTTETWTFLVGPHVGSGAFRRAVATASIAGWIVQAPPNGSGPYEVTVLSVEADWDDESGRTEVRVEIRASSHIPDTAVIVTRLNFSVSIVLAV